MDSGLCEDDSVGERNSAGHTAYRYTPAPIVIPNGKRKRELFPFEDDGHTLTAADAESGEAEVEVAAFHLVHEGDDNAGAGTADGVPERDTAAVKVGLGHVDI